MSDSTLKRGLQNSIDNHSLEDGKIYFSIDQGRIFTDTSNERIEFSDFIKGLTYNEIMNLETPLPKMYLSTDTRQLLAYDFTTEQWVAYSGGSPIDPQVVISMQEQIEEMQETLDRYERIIEIIEQEYGING